MLEKDSKGVQNKVTHKVSRALYQCEYQLTWQCYVLSLPLFGPQNRICRLADQPEGNSGDWRINEGTAQPLLAWYV